MMIPRSLAAGVAAFAFASTGAGAAHASAALWGEEGHTMVAEAAARGLPSDVPAFFRDAAPRLRYLNPEPDRWRDREARAMDEAYKYDHYIDLENVPEEALSAPDRYEYLEALYAAGLREPEQAAGFLPYRIVELYQRLESGFARWRSAGSAEERGWIEERIINDAGILGHYVADAANPHHTTIHYNGWAADAPNPDGYTTSRDFHWRFEGEFVEANISLEEVERDLAPGARVLDDVRGAVLGFLRESHAQVVPLYQLEKRQGFRPGHATPDTEAFTAARLAAGADMLRALWYTAWNHSAARPAPGG